ncbi:hypothetical protein NEIG_00556 [Nematocida sp. ERTm5]|nr:hypothetical protein NEIG_00556 [Nematocida sp. ERTm5]
MRIHRIALIGLITRRLVSTIDMRYCGLLHEMNSLQSAICRLYRNQIGLRQPWLLGQNFPPTQKLSTHLLRQGYSYPMTSAALHARLGLAGYNNPSQLGSLCGDKTLLICMPNTSSTPDSPTNNNTYNPYNNTPDSPTNNNTYNPYKTTPDSPTNNHTYNPYKTTPDSPTNSNTYNPYKTTPDSPTNNNTYNPYNNGPGSSITEKEAHGNKKEVVTDKSNLVITIGSTDKHGNSVNDIISRIIIKKPESGDNLATNSKNNNLYERGEPAPQFFDSNTQSKNTQSNNQTPIILSNREKPATRPLAEQPVNDISINASLHAEKHTDREEDRGKLDINSNNNGESLHEDLEIDYQAEKGKSYTPEKRKLHLNSTSTKKKSYKPQNHYKLGKSRKTFIPRHNKENDNTAQNSPINDESDPSYKELPCPDCDVDNSSNISSDSGAHIQSSKSKNNLKKELKRQKKLIRKEIENQFKEKEKEIKKQLDAIKRQKKEDEKLFKKLKKINDLNYNKPADETPWRRENPYDSDYPETVPDRKGYSDDDDDVPPPSRHSSSNKETLQRIEQALYDLERKTPQKQTKHHYIKAIPESEPETSIVYSTPPEPVNYIERKHYIFNNSPPVVKKTKPVVYIRASSIL